MMAAKGLFLRRYFFVCGFMLYVIIELWNYPHARLLPFRHAQLPLRYARLLFRHARLLTGHLVYKQTEQKPLT